MMPNTIGAIKFLIKFLILLVVALPCAISAQFDIETELFEIQSLAYGHDLNIQFPIDTSTINQIKSQFNPISKLDHKLAKGSWDHWLLLSCQNTSDIEEEFIFDFKNWCKVNIQDLGTLDDKIYTTGHLIPFKQRDFPTSNEALISMDFDGGETKNLLIHLESDIDFLQVPSTVAFNVVNGKQYLNKRLRKRLLFGMFCGFYLIMFLYNLFIYASIKDRNYIPYLVALIAVLIITIHIFGFFVPIFQDWPNYVFFHSKMQFFSSMLLGLSMLTFTSWFLDIKNRYPKYHKMLRILMLIIVFLPLPSLLGYASINEKISGLVGISTMVFILTLAFKSKLDKYPSSGFFLIGYGAFSIGIILMLCTFIGILPTHFQEFYPVNIGSTIEMVFFSLALGNRINLLKKDNELKQAQIIEQLQEKEEIQTKLNRELEEKVVIRTQEIQRQKEEIQGQKEEIEKEKIKADELLLNILPAPVARELKIKGTATPRYYENATVLFADIVGFTKKTQAFRPERIINELDYCFRGFDEILEKHNVEKIKTIGDGYMCVGGVPIPSENSAINTVKAALEMQEFMTEWAKQKKDWEEDPWQIRIGIHSGEVVAGIVGKKKFAYDVWGMVVNVASRIEGACEPNMVNISEDTHTIIKSHFDTKYRGKIETQERELNMYYVLKEK